MVGTVASVAEKGRFADVLGVSEQFLPRTTNHLESFNHRIKSRYFASYQHSGRLPCIDVWVLVLITKVFSFVELFAY